LPRLTNRRSFWTPPAPASTLIPSSGTPIVVLSAMRGVQTGRGAGREKGTPVLQMEAMKLIPTLKAPVSGRIQSIRCAEGDTVPAGALLIEISPEEAEEKR
jgi:biotin carboxyl carrier protein